MEKLYHRLFYLIGLFCTANAFAIGIGNSSMSVYNYLIIILLLIKSIQILLSRNSIIYISSNNIIWYLYFFVMFLSVIISAFTMPENWFKESINLTLKFSIYFLGLLVLFGDKDLSIYKPSFMRGLYISTILQLFWAGLQALCWYGLGFNLNELIFGSLLHIGGGTINWDGAVLGPVLRLTGFSWEPANFALVMLVGWSLSKKIWLKGFFILALIFSYSKTGFLCMLVLGTVKYLVCLKNFTIRSIFSINYIKRFLFFVFIVIIFILIFTDFFYNLVDVIVSSYNTLTLAITTEENASANIHKLYYLALGDILNNMSLWQLLFGYGSFSAGYPYAFYNIVPYGLDGAWNPESDFITIIVGNGFIGILLYYLIVIKAFYNASNWMERDIIIAIFVCGITYLFIRGTWSFLILLFISINYTRRLKNEKNDVSI